MPRQLRQNDQVDLGQIMQLYSLFSPEAQARTQLVQQQATQAPQLNQAQLDAIHAEIAERTARTATLGPQSDAAIAAQNASTRASTVQTDLAPEQARASVDAHDAQTRYQNELMRYLGPRSEAEIASIQAGTGKTLADTNATSLLLPGQVKLGEANLEHLGAETNLTNAQATELPADSKAKRDLYGSETAKNIIGISPFIQDKTMSGAILDEGIGRLGPNVQANVAKGQAVLKARQVAMVNDTVTRFGVKRAKEMLIGMPPELFAAHENTGPTTQELVPASNPYAGQVNKAIDTESKKVNNRQKEALLAKYATAYQNRQMYLGMPDIGFFSPSANAKKQVVDEQLKVAEQLKSLGVDVTSLAFLKQLQDYGITLDK